MPKLPKTPRDGYQVGYAKPPRATRFQPGVSGNPRGRPRGSKNKVDVDGLFDDLIAEANRQVMLTENGRQRPVPTTRAMVRALVADAFKGSTYAKRAFLHLVEKAQVKRADWWREFVQIATDYKMDGLRRLAQLESENIEEILVPDPRRMQITADMVVVAGPSTLDEQEQYCALQSEFERQTKVLISVRLNRPADEGEFWSVVHNMEQLRRQLNGFGTVFSRT